MPAAPGPRAPALVQTARWALNAPLQMLDRHHRRYGDVFRIQVLGPRCRSDGTGPPLMRRTIFVFSAPGHVREIFARSGDELRAGEAQEFLEWFLGPRSLMVLDGPGHLDERRELVPLLGPERMPDHERAMRSAAARALARWPGSTHRLQPLLDDVLMEMNCELAFGARPEDFARLRNAVRRARPAFAAPVLFLPLLRAGLGRWSPGGRLRALHETIRDVVAARMAGPAAARTHDGRPADLLDALIDAEPPDGPAQPGRLLSRIVTLVGGMDSAGAAIAWTCLHLLRNPAALAHCRDEAHAGEAADGSWLDAAFREAVRLHPPFPTVVRRVARPLRIAGYDFDPGTILMPSMYLLHRRPELFPDPDAFRPERFLGSTLPGRDYVPFGSGIRRCIGQSLAPRMSRILLSELLRRFDVRPLGRVPETPGRRNVTVVPAARVRVRLERTR